MHVRGRPAFGRPTILALIVATLALVLVGSSAAFAAGGSAPASAERATPRVQQPGDAAGYRLPFGPGLEVPIEQGWHSTYSHNGRAEYAYDFGLYVGTPVLAAASGVVSHVHAGETACGGAELRNHANYVTIDHPDGSATHYGHLSTVDVEVGDVVAAGQQIARSGKTGYSGCMPHLHFARQAQGGPVTQSVPLYFDGYPDRPLRDGEIVTAPAPECVAAAAATDAGTGAETDVKADARSDAKARARIEAKLQAEAPLGAFCGTYSAKGGEGPSYFSRLDDAIDFNWTEASPGGYWLEDAADGFSARWSGQFTFAAAGSYAIGVIASDRVRISIDGVTVLNDWTDHKAARELVTKVTVTPGIHRIDVEVDDDDGKEALRLDWARCSVTTTPNGRPASNHWPDRSATRRWIPGRQGPRWGSMRPASRIIEARLFTWRLDRACHSESSS